MELEWEFQLNYHRSNWNLKTNSIEKNYWNCMFMVNCCYMELEWEFQLNYHRSNWNLKTNSI